MTAEEWYFADNVTYTAGVSRLARYRQPEGTSTSVSLTYDGWYGSVTDSTLGLTCRVFIGSDRGPIPPEVEEGEAACHELP